MSISVAELVPQQLYYIHVMGRPEIDELRKLSDQQLNLLEKSQSPLVHSIINLQNAQHHPHLGEVYRALTPLLAHQKVGWTVVYHLEDRMINFMFGVIASMFKLRVRFVKDYVEALEFIQTVDQTLGRWGAEQIQEPFKVEMA